MSTNTTNPFNVTKADDFSEKEIVDMWLDIGDGNGFAGMIQPKSLMPMLVIGGKGSGKTHLLRYFSSAGQRLRYGDGVVDGIKNDGYLGVYLKFGGLNTGRFKDKGQTEDVWADVFAYYMELWLSQTLLSCVDDLLGSALRDGAVERKFVEQVCALFDEPPAGCASCDDLREYLRTLQRRVDSAVNNCPRDRPLAFACNASRGRLVFGIPLALAEHVECLREVVFVYLLDEFENIDSVHQRYVNTLLRERSRPCSFKIGSRLYGVRTYSTFSAGEENREGSEFEVLHLDARLRGDKRRYIKFARKLVAKRILDSGAVANQRTLPQQLDGYFQTDSASRFCLDETAFVISKYAGRERPYIRTLRERLERGAAAKAAPGVESDAEINRVLEQIRVQDFPLLEKVNTLLLYKTWSSSGDLPSAAELIRDECSKVIGGEVVRRYDRLFHHFKADLLAQLFRECDRKQKYNGLPTFIDMSWGTPRNLLVILKHVYGWSTFLGESPFVAGTISARAQAEGVPEATDWFFNDARMPGGDGALVQKCINRLGTLFRAIRFSDKPSECSCSAFSADLGMLNAEARRILDIAQKWSLLVRVGDQSDRNSERVDAKFQLNRMIAPRWQLAVYRRGTLALRPEEVNAIFGPTSDDSFERIYEARVSRMMAPFFGRESTRASVNSREKPLLPGFADE